MSVQVTVRGVGSMVMRNTSQCANCFHPGYCPSEPHCVFNQQVQIMNIKNDHYDRFHPHRPPPAQSWLKPSCQHWLTAEVVWTWPHRSPSVHKQDRDVSSRARCALSPHHPHSLMFRGVMMNEWRTHRTSCCRWWKVKWGCIWSLYAYSRQSFITDRATLLMRSNQVFLLFRYVGWFAVTKNVLGSDDTKGTFHRLIGVTASLRSHLI